MENIDQFNKVVGLIFAELYEAFPVKRTISITDFTDEDIEHYWIKGEPCFYRLDGHALIVSESMDYLIKEGFISATFPGPVEFSSCRLTNKGFTALGAMPKGLESSGTLGDQLIGFAKDSAMQQGKEGVAALVKMALAFGTSYLASP